MTSSIIALVTINFQWVRHAGLEKLLVPLANNRNPSLTGTLVLPATHYDGSDPSFVEVVFSSPELELDGAVCVPKAEVIAIVKTSAPEDLHKVGYMERATSSGILTASPVDTPPETESETSFVTN